MKIYLDLDGVLADFEAGYKKASRGRFDRGSPDGSRSEDGFHMEAAAAMAMVGAGTMAVPTTDAFWKVVLDAKDFWLNLPVMEGAQELWQACLRTGAPVEILSAPSSRDTERAIEQKKEWFGKHFCPNTKMNFRKAREKAEFATPNAVLIDDYHPNIVAWALSGGMAIHHLKVEQSISFLEEIAERVRGGRPQLAVAFKMYKTHAPLKTYEDQRTALKAYRFLAPHLTEQEKALLVTAEETAQTGAYADLDCVLGQIGNRIGVK